MKVKLKLQKQHNALAWWRLNFKYWQAQVSAHPDNPIFKALLERAQDVIDHLERQLYGSNRP